MYKKHFFTSFMNGIVIAVPPILPTCMNIVSLSALKRLKKYHITTKTIGKIIENGRVNLICFDKTGTLTMK